MKRLKLRWRRGSRQCFGPEFKQVGCIGGLPSHTLGSDMKTSISGSFLLMLAAVVPLAAQTPPPATPPHRAAATAGAPTHRSAGGCVTPAPKISEKIPALPASAPCVKTLYTVTRMATSKLDYASPLVSEEARESLGSGPATFSLNYVDTQVGTGDPVKQGKWLSVHYTGYLATDGTKFDSSHDHPGGQPISFPYGQHQVIQGWDTGFEGMRMGGKRRLYVPYELAYGETGKGPIPAKSELIFDVELISQSDTRPTPGPGTKLPGTPGGRPGLPPGMTPPGSKMPPPGAPPSSGGPGAGMATKPGVTPPPGTTPGPATPPNGASTPPAMNPQTPPQGTSGTTPPPGSSTPPSGSSSPQPQL